MKEILVESFGKINLGLDVLYKRNDGYHEINTIMQQISLCDTLRLQEHDKGIIIESNRKDLPKDSSNLVHKAWEEIKKISGIEKGIRITIEKRIPIAAGLAGGSSNAAAVLKGLNELWNIGLNPKELMDIGVQIGADVPYCIMGGTALAQGIGERLKKLKDFKDKSLLLINTGIEISTAEVYNNLNLKGRSSLDTEKIISFMEKDDIKSLGENLVNIMEDFVFEKHPIIAEIKKDMLKQGALGSLMSGSGPTVFGIFQGEEESKYAEKKLKEKYPNSKVLLAKTI